MNKMFFVAIFNSLIHPAKFKVILFHLLGLTYKKYSNISHLESTIDWLTRAQDNSRCGGCCASYVFHKGWDLPYPETTGYIISTFLRYALFIDNSNLVERAKQMGDWEIAIQLPSGAVRGGVGINDFPIVFNTGMVILGWADLYKHTGYDRYLEASVKAADWLCANLDSDGKWSKYTYNEIPHAYHSRVSWALLEVYQHTKDSKYRDAAIANIAWVLSLVQENGWIEEMGFIRDEIPFTHTIAYTLRGLLECSFFFDQGLKSKTQDTVIHAAEIIMYKYERNKKHPYSIPKLLAGNFNNKWNSQAKFSCLTGNAQLAIIWLKIYQLNKDARFLNSALKLLDQIKELQDIKSSNPGIRGGIAGSYPIWGSYMPFHYPNWSAKFFADALMLQDSIMVDLEKE